MGKVNMAIQAIEFKGQRQRLSRRSPDRFFKSSNLQSYFDNQVNLLLSVLPVGKQWEAFPTL
jgi:hypothetical protein